MFFKNARSRSPGGASRALPSRRLKKAKPKVKRRKAVIPVPPPQPAAPAAPIVVPVGTSPTYRKNSTIGKFIAVCGDDLLRAIAVMEETLRRTGNQTRAADELWRQHPDVFRERFSQSGFGSMLQQLKNLHRARQSSTSVSSSSGQKAPSVQAPTPPRPAGVRTSEAPKPTPRSNAPVTKPASSTPTHSFSRPVRPSGKVVAHLAPGSVPRQEKDESADEVRRKSGAPANIYVPPDAAASIEEECQRRNVSRGDLLTAEYVKGNAVNFSQAHHLPLSAFFAIVKEHNDGKLPQLQGEADKQDAQEGWN